MTKCRKDPTRGIFMRRGLLRGIKNDIYMCLTHKYKNTNTHIHKYTNTEYDKVPERPKFPQTDCLILPDYSPNAVRNLFSVMYGPTHRYCIYTCMCVVQIKI